MDKSVLFKADSQAVEPDVFIQVDANVIGFAALFMPAGNGVREVALQQMFAKEMSAMPLSVAEGLATVTAIVLRVLWTIAEIVAASLLYWFAPAAKALPAPVLAEVSND